MHEEPRCADWRIIMQVGIPEEVLDVTSLTKLVLTSNRVKEISLRLCDMEHLRDLWLSRNLIR